MKNSELLQAAYAILSRRAYSERELKQKLLKKGYDEEQINEAVYYLSERGYLNDTALSGMLVRKYVKCGKYGTRAIINKITQRGISSEIIQETMANHNFDELAQAITIIEKMLNKSEKADNAKISRFLINRGFSYSIIRQVIEEVETGYRK